MKIVSSGHGLKVAGASSIYMDEVTEARRVVNRVSELCKEMGDPITIFHENVATTVKGNLDNIVSFHNSKSGTHDVSIHFNSFNGSASGVEVFGYDNGTRALGEKICRGLSSAIGIPNRGFKINTGLRFLNSTKKPAILIEVCFLDNEKDATSYKRNFEKVCIGIAEALTGKTYKPSTSAPPTSNGQLFAVCVGAYNRTNADRVLEEVKAKGYKDAYLIPR